MHVWPATGRIVSTRAAGKISQKQGYTQSKVTPGFWTHAWRPISFTLLVDDFGVKYVGKEHANHLVRVLKEKYEISEDWGGKKYIGLTFDCDYRKRQVHVSMTGYVNMAMIRFKHQAPKRRQDQPYQHVIPSYGAKVQYAVCPDGTALLDKDDQKFFQQVTGTFLYYSRAVDNTMLAALCALASKQASSTRKTMEKVMTFLDYAASQEEAVITYHESDMVLACHSDASYLSEPGARSRAGGHFFLSSNAEMPANNGAVLNIAQIIKAIMDSAAEAEIGAMYINAR